MEYPKSIVLDGIRFTRSGKPYYYNSRRRIHLHQYIWKKAHGDIPDGYHIHHIDGDAFNNDLSNLQAIDPVEHLKLHGRNLSEERRDAMRRNLDEKARPKAIEWHGSEQGKEWHKKHYLEHAEKLHARVERECSNCGKKHDGLPGRENYFCCNACKSAYRRKQGYDNVEKKCIVCGGKFTSNKYAKSKTCSTTCRSKLIWENRRVKDSPNLQE